MLSVTASRRPPPSAGKSSRAATDHGARWCSYVLAGALIKAGDLAAETACAAALAQTPDTGHLQNQAILLSQLVILDLEAGRLQDAAAHLREAIQLDTRTAKWGELGNAWTAACCARRLGAPQIIIGKPPQLGTPNHCGPSAARGRPETKTRPDVQE